MAGNRKVSEAGTKRVEAIKRGSGEAVPLENWGSRDLVGEVMELLQSGDSASSRHNAQILIDQELRQRFCADEGDGYQITRFEGAIKSETHKILGRIIEFFGNFSSSFPEIVSSFRKLLDVEIDLFVEMTISGISIPLEEPEDNVVDYGKLLKRFATQLKQRLRQKGWSAAKAARATHAYMDNMQPSVSSVFNFRDPVHLNAAVDLAAAGLLTAGPTASFERAAKPTLPPRAPEIWAERDRSTKENPLAFLRRVWGAYMEAGVLYQDDIKRLGDNKLVQRVRNHCLQVGLKASDVLPPPRQARLERALAEVAPGSPAEIVLRGRLANREASKRWRRTHKPR